MLFCTFASFPHECSHYVLHVCTTKTTVNTRDFGVAQWWGTFPACSRLWIWFPALKRKHNDKHWQGCVKGEAFTLYTIYVIQLLYVSCIYIDGITKLFGLWETVWWFVKNLKRVNLLLSNFTLSCISEKKKRKVCLYKNFLQEYSWLIFHNSSE